MSTAAVAPAGRELPHVVTGGVLARGAVFVPLCLFGLLGWTTLIAGEGHGVAWAMTICAALAGLTLQAGAALTGARTRRLLSVVVTIALLVAALLCAGVSPSLLQPARWDELASGIAEGIGAIPAIASPYRGGEVWIEVTVLLGGMLLAAIAALQAFWPVRDGALRSPIAAAMTLTTLFGVSVIEVPPERAVLHGSLFALLLAAFLFADRIGPAQVAPAAIFICVVTLAAAALVPAIDAERPWIDLQSISEDVANVGTTTYDWNHDYSPLQWPRDGRELLRIKAERPAYWKAQVLDDFDGREWVNTRRMPPFESDSEIDIRHENWTQQIRVRVSGLRSEQFVLAGTIRDLDSSKRAVPVGGGTYVTERGLLRRGATYGGRVYTPTPTTGELATAGVDYPSAATAWLTVEIPGPGGAPQPGDPVRRTAVTFAPFGSDGADRVATASGIPTVGEVAKAVKGTGLERAYRLARSLKRSHPDPYEYVRAVLARVQRKGVYTEQPATSRAPLDSFLFDTHRGYCQHFSGAMALLLRMGGIPARVAVGFAPGQLDSRSDEYVIRDYDAHSWVEAYFPQIGWVTYDPTPAAAPPRDQTADRALSLQIRRSSGEGDRLSDPASGSAAVEDGPNLLVRGVAALALLVPVALLIVLLRRRRRARPSHPPELAELERALRVSGRTAKPSQTLADLERRLATTPEARAYLRAVAAQRFGASGEPPTETQRRAMRRELASGLGRVGRLRAWWAMPPRLFAARASAR